MGKPQQIRILKDFLTHIKELGRRDKWQGDESSSEEEEDESEGDESTVASTSKSKSKDKFGFTVEQVIFQANIPILKLRRDGIAIDVS